MHDLKEDRSNHTFDQLLVGWSILKRFCCTVFPQLKDRLYQKFVQRVDVLHLFFIKLGQTVKMYGSRDVCAL